MRYNEIGINVDSVDKLILDIYNYAERINKTLNQIANIVDGTKEYFCCDAADQYRSKFESFQTNFSVINKNMIAYADDLIKLKNRYQNIDNDLTFRIRKATEKMESKNW